MLGLYWSTVTLCTLPYTYVYLINKLELVQRRFTKCVKAFGQILYAECPDRLNAAETCEIGPYYDCLYYSGCFIFIVTVFFMSLIVRPAILEVTIFG